MFNELPILQGECAVCVLCDQPIVGDILHCAGSPACEGCAATFQAEYDAAYPPEEEGYEEYETSPYNGDDDTDPEWYSDPLDGWYDDVQEYPE